MKWLLGNGGGIEVERLKFYAEEPSWVKRVMFWVWGKGMYLFPLSLVVISELLVVLVYLVLLALMSAESTRNWVKMVGNWFGKPYRKFKESRWVSERLRRVYYDNRLITKEVTVDREMILYPYTEITKDESNYYLFIEMIPGQTEVGWESCKDAFANALHGKLVKFKVENGWIEIVIQYEMLKPQMYTKEDDEHVLVIGKGAMGPVEWEFDTFPHMLVVGPTRQGKSTFMRSIFVQFPKDWDVRVLDGKAVEFSFLKRYGFETHVGYDWEKVFEGVWEEMNNRYKKMEEMGV